MAILVDPAIWPWRGREWAHLVSDSSYAELHAFAALLGIPREAFQGDHYDVPDRRPRPGDRARRATPWTPKSWSGVCGQRAFAGRAISARLRREQDQLGGEVAPRCRLPPRRPGGRSVELVVREQVAQDLRSTGPEHRLGHMRVLRAHRRRVRCVRLSGRRRAPRDRRRRAPPVAVPCSHVVRRGEQDQPGHLAHASTPAAPSSSSTSTASRGAGLLVLRAGRVVHRVVEVRSKPYGVGVRRGVRLGARRSHRPDRARTARCARSW